MKETEKIKYIKKDIKSDDKTEEKEIKVSADEVTATKKDELKDVDKTGWWS